MEDGKRLAFIKGAPEIVLDRCTHILEDGGMKALTGEERSKILKANEKWHKIH